MFSERRIDSITEERRHGVPVAKSAQRKQRAGCQEKDRTD